MTNLFGTDGIRSKVGSFPLTFNDLTNLGKAISLWSLAKVKEPKILIATDTRISADVLKNSLKSGLLQYKINLFDAQILPTPIIYQLVQKQKLFDFGLMLTASHNPFHDNGVKIISKNNVKISEADEVLISEYFINQKFKDIDYENLGKEYFYFDSEKNYLNDIQKYFEDEFLKNKKIILDCANGATSTIAINIFKNFGANIITINNQPNGKNINSDCGSTKPKALQEKVISEKADFGFAFDGDGDRIAIVTKDGNIKDGDEILAFLSESPKYKNQDIVGTIMSNLGLELFMQRKSQKMWRTQVGDKYVVQKLIDEKLLLGGEQSGHIIMLDYLNSSDGIFTALSVAQEALRTNNLNMDSFIKFPQLIMNLQVEKKKNLKEEPFASIIKNSEKKIQPGRLVVRYSGTESLLRIMVESENTEKANEMTYELLHQLKQLL